MKQLTTATIIILVGIGFCACKGSAYVQHTVRMVDAKSYLDRPATASTFYR